jgi:hypothetical protein
MKCDCGRVHQYNADMAGHIITCAQPTSRGGANCSRLIKIPQQSMVTEAKQTAMKNASA